MNRFDTFADAFRIFQKYANSDSDVCAEHDQMWAYIQNELVSAEDMAELERLGWHFDDEFDAWTRYV